MKNLHSIILVTALICSLLSGCGSVPTSVASTSAAPSQPVTPDPAAEAWRDIAAPGNGSGRAIYLRDGVLVLTAGEEGGRVVSRLVTDDGFDKTATFVVDDTNFLIAISTDDYWDDSPTDNTLRLSANVDTQSKSAILSNGKITCRVDFDTGETAIERNYIRGMMEEVLDSLDGLTLYSADSMGMGDGRWSDLVFAVDKWTYQFICELNNADTAVLLDKDTVAVNRNNSMEFYGVESGKLLDTKLEFDNEPDNEGNTPWDIVNMIPDRENKQLVVLTRDAREKEGGNGWEPEYRVNVLVFDYAGKLLKQLETGLSTPLYNDNGFFYRLNMSLSNGKVQIMDDEENPPVIVNYR